MSVQVTTDPATGEVELLFILADDVHDGVVSVVGSFNQWTAGVDVLQPQPDGTRSVAVRVESNSEFHFRYLGSGGKWFDDHDTDSTEYGSVIRVEHHAPDSSSSPGEPGEGDGAKRKSSKESPR